MATRALNRRRPGLPEGCSPPTQLCGWLCPAAARNLPPSATKDRKVPSLPPSLQHHKPLPRSRSSLKTYSTIWETDLQPWQPAPENTRVASLSRALGGHLSWVSGIPHSDHV